MKIAIDLMGGDNAPKEIILGCKKYIKEYPEDTLLLYGTEEVSENVTLKEIIENSSSEFFLTESFVAMDESPLAIKKEKNNSTIVQTMNSHRNGISDCIFTCGNSGAAILSAIDTVGMLNNQVNVALMSFIPVYQRNPVGIIDVGALGNRTLDAKVYSELTKLAVKFYKDFFNNNDPSVKLLNIGTESWKGTAEHKVLYTLLKDTLHNFQGNVEGDGILRGDADIIISDGFTGNVILKLIESMHDLFIKDLDKTHCNNSNNFLHFLVEEFNYESLGGAPLLGVNGKVVLGHGKSSANAVFSGLKFCRKYAQIN
ncbi:MAG: hypothetical protein PF574_07470 [Candidatus Delongbacteria bacterium]|jgi:glycerol-3-phosphate acyltransferase PlsX|nr:hypothetical protein [Candidatus Delongbacteria bacterium]